MLPVGMNSQSFNLNSEARAQCMQVLLPGGVEIDHTTMAEITRMIPTQDFARATSV